jgi:hypothetical protein
MYDIYGKEVRTVSDEMKSAGEYSVKVDVSNLPPGMYVFRLQAGNECAVEKLVVR